MFLRAALGIVLLALSVIAAHAQTNVITNPLPSNSADVSGTIAQTGVFQKVLSAQVSPNKRLGCLIQNKSSGSNTMSVYVHSGGNGNASSGSAYDLVGPATGVQGGSFNCWQGGVVIQDQIDITGTAGDVYVIRYQGAGP